jgi:long-chain fatty acid transport protein
MSLRTERPLRALLPATILLALVAGDASASGFQLNENEARGMGRAYAGSTAAPDDAAVVVNNPAAMSEFERPLFQADLTAINFSTEFHGGGSDAIGQPLHGGYGGDGGATKPVPALYFATPFGDRWHLGAGISAPFGFVTDWDDGWMGRYQAQKSELQSVALTLSAAWTVSERFSLGASLVAQHTSAELTSAVNFGAILGANPNLPPGLFLPQSADGFAKIDGDDWGYGWQLGALWKPTDRDRIGFTYHSQIDHTLEGDADFTVPDIVQGVFDQAGVTAFQDTGGKADFDTPWVATASWWHALNERVSFGADLSYTHWSSLRELVVRYGNPAQPDSGEAFDWDNTWFGSVGMDYRLDDKWTLRGGLALDQSPTHEETRTPRVPDETRKWVSVGLTYEWSDRADVSLGYVHLFVDDAKVSGSSSATGDRLQGHFEDEGNLFAISGQIRF